MTLPNQSVSAGESPRHPEGPRLRRRIRSWLLIALMVAFSLAVLQVDFAIFGAYGYLGIFVMMILCNATVLIPAPAFAIAIAAGQTLNPWLVGLASGLGAGLGETTGYLIGREGRQILSNKERWELITARISRYGAFAVFVFAALPMPLMDLAGIAAGMLRMPFWKYLLACCCGKTIRFTILALIGAGYGGLG